MRFYNACKHHTETSLCDMSGVCVCVYVWVNMYVCVLTDVAYLMRVVRVHDPGQAKVSDLEQ